MNYKITCPNCKKGKAVSSHDAVKYEDAKGRMHYSWDCPECKEEIIAGTNRIRRK